MRKRGGAVSGPWITQFHEATKELAFCMLTPAGVDLQERHGAVPHHGVLLRGRPAAGHPGALGAVSRGGRPAAA